MSPLDKELRDALTRHADDVPADADLFATVERRARTIRRRRTAALVTGTAVVVAAVAVAVPAVLDASRHDDGRGRFAVSTTPTPSSSATVARIGVMSWPLAGDPSVTVDESRLRTTATTTIAATAARHWPGSEVADVVPLWRGLDKQGRTAALVVARVVAGQQTHYVAGAWVDNGDGSETFGSLHDVTVDTPEVSAVVDGPGPDPGTVIVVGTPGTGQLSYRAPGGAWQPVEHIDGARSGERWAAFPRALTPTPGELVDQIQVLDGNGDLDHPLYEGPIGRGVTFPDV